MACASPLSFETLVAYWAGELDTAETDRADEHLFSCAACTAASARIASITETLRAHGSPIVTPSRVAEWRARGRIIEDNVVAPNETSNVTFREQDFIIHHLGGLDLAGAERVQITVRVVETGALILEHPDAPYDREAGEVLVACQRHFAAFPPNIVFEATVHRAEGEAQHERYVVRHAFVAA